MLLSKYLTSGKFMLPRESKPPTSFVVMSVLALSTLNPPQSAAQDADEAFAHWPREEVLRDVVTVIRTYRPQVIISVWAGTPRDGHGQHEASGILANEAFDAAADPDRFPDLGGMAAEPWSVAKLYHSVRFRGPETLEPSLTVQTGTFDPLLGRSYHQLAMESRSKHRSQEMGSAQALGARTSGLRLVQSRVGGLNSDRGIFARVDTTLARLVDMLPGPAAPAVGPAPTSATR